MTTQQEMETAFRDVERRLDALLLHAMPTLATLGIEVLDESDRQGRELYCWQHSFDWARRGELIRRVKVTICWREPLGNEAAGVEVWSRTEAFRLGKASEFVHDTSETLSLDNLVAAGLFEVVERAIHAGRKILDEGPDPKLVAERARTETALQRAGDWDFYSKLGSERAAVRCRENGCVRGAITLSVFCKAHHFQRIMGRPCPFENEA